MWCMPRTGLDEISLNSKTSVWELTDGEIRQYTISPEDLGLAPALLESLAGGSVEENAEIMTDVLRGASGPRRDVVVANAAGGIVAGGKAADLREGVQIAQESIDSGRGYGEAGTAQESQPRAGVSRGGKLLAGSWARPERYSTR